MRIAAGRMYASRDGSKILITRKHSKWPQMFEGRPEHTTGKNRWTWTLSGNYLHRNGEPHRWDLVADIGPGVSDKK